MNTLENKLELTALKINSLIDIPLFSILPLAELDSLNKEVSDEDSLSLCINSLCNLFDRINKKELDKFIGIDNSSGSRDCFVKLLKKLLPTNHNKIDENVDKPLGMILLLRAYFIHKRNSKIKKAEEYFEIKFPIKDYSSLWNKVYYQFSSVLDIVNELLDEKENPNYKIQESIDDETTILLRDNFINKHSTLLNDISVKKVLLFLYSEKSMSDCDVAKEFRYPVYELRELLLPCVPSLIYPQFIDKKSTMISLTPIGKSIIESLYLGDKE